ncbi:hypothetical protein Mapa_015167 [Marchantia paleacea]|nr:hypothetical protein Mapa_015167 [Marchantia paleacea]
MQVGLSAEFPPCPPSVQVCSSSLAGREGHKNINNRSFKPDDFRAVMLVLLCHALPFCDSSASYAECMCCAVHQASISVHTRAFLSPNFRRLTRSTCVGTASRF